MELVGQRALADTQQEFTRIAKGDLQKEVKANRDKHNQEYQEALEGWRNECLTVLKTHVEKCNAQLGDIEGGKEILFPTVRQPAKPEDHTGDYDRVIKRLEMSQDAEIYLSHHDFDSYVLDQWDWTDRHRLSNALYSGKK